MISLAVSAGQRTLALWGGYPLDYLGKKLLPFLIVICFLGNAKATSNFVGLNGKNLYSICQSQDRALLSACEGYLIGIQDTVQNHKFGFLFSLCFPDGVTVTTMRLNLLEFMQLRTHLHEEPGIEFVTGMLNKNYSCNTN